MQPMNLEGKKFLITGASSGMGRATAIYLSTLGANLVITGRNFAELEFTRDQLEGKEHFIIPADLTEPDVPHKLITDGIKADGKKFSGMIHFAGGGKAVPLRMLVPKIVEDTMQINYFVFIQLVREISSKYAMKTGSIIGVSSYAAMEGEAGLTAYCGAKAAMDASVRAIACELASKNIRINTIRPGIINTSGTAKYLSSMDQKQTEELIRKQRLGLGEPDDVAALCAFLLSDCGKFITGRNMYIDGGRF